MDDFELIVKHIIAQAANGWAQRQRRYLRDAYHFCAISGKTRLRASGKAAACTELVEVSDAR